VFDIGFAELIIIAVVGLLVIGPERLPSAIRTASLWLNRIKRGFTDIKREVEQELHNDAVLQELKKTGQELQGEANNIGSEINDIAAPLKQSVVDDSAAAKGGQSKETSNDK
jgi:sec-independent protein translocase protein TatB